MTINPHALGFLPEGSPARPAATNPATAARLYQQTASTDPERTSGSQTRYNSFADFVTTFEQEARDPTRIGAADILDIINPLQHLPLVSTLYRDMTGDAIKPGPRMIGGAVFGGGMGLASSSVNAVVEAETGKDITGNMALALSGEPSFVTQESGSPADPVKLAMGLAPEVPNEPMPIEIIWNDAPEPARADRTRSSPQHVASAYARAENAAPLSAPAPGTMTRLEPASTATASRFERVVMTDPERMAGSFIRYV